MIRAFESVTGCLCRQLLAWQFNHQIVDQTGATQLCGGQNHQVMVVDLGRTQIHRVADFQIIGDETSGTLLRLSSLDKPCVVASATAQFLGNRLQASIQRWGGGALFVAEVAVTKP